MTRAEAGSDSLATAGLGLDGDVVRRLGALAPADEPIGRTIARARLRSTLFAEPPPTVGRYVILERVGVGGMGVVYSAHDPELDRKVAIKLLHHSYAADDEARARLVREAQALARLAHPNVVTVHDVGTLTTALDDGPALPTVFVAMEFVDGVTLGQWQRAAVRGWHEVVALLLEIGRGVAAAHAADLIHRDLKPENVMIGRDGRARVMDFGLARVHDEPSLQSGPTSTSSPSSDDVTRTGALVGTPAYMAPEQHAGLPASPASDQFSFCVMAWEALYGARPFQGRSYGELASAVAEGRITSGTSRKVPRWIREILRRGLALDPAARWPTLQHLLDALARDPQRRRRWIAAGIVTLVAGGSALTVRELDRRNTEAACASDAASIAEVWNDDVRARMRDAFVATEVPVAASMFDRTTPWLDGFAEQWSAAREQHCLAARGTADVDGAQHGALACLDDRRDRFASLVDELLDADPELVARAVSDLGGVDPIQRCEDEAWVRRVFAEPSDPETREATGRVRSLVARAHVVRNAGRFAKARELGLAAEVAAHALGDDAVIADAEVLLGTVEQDLGRPTFSRAILERAYWRAGAAGEDDTALRAALALASTLGSMDQARAEEWIRNAEMWIDRTESRGGRYESDLLTQKASLAIEQTNIELAASLCAQMLEIDERIYGPEHPVVAADLSYAANVDMIRADVPAARQKLERALEIAKVTTGLEHPEAAVWRANLGMLAESEGRYDEAIAAYESSLAIIEAVRGPEHPDVAKLHDSIGRALFISGDPAGALERQRHALEIHERGSDPFAIAMSLHNLGTLAAALGDDAQALAYHRRAVELAAKGRPHDTHLRAQMLAALGSALVKSGDPEAGRRRLDEALTLAETDEAGPDTIAHVLDQQGKVAGELGEHRRAVEYHRRAVEVRAKAGRSGIQDLDSLLGIGLAQLELGEYQLASETLASVRPIVLAHEVPVGKRAELEFATARAAWGLHDRLKAIASAELALSTARSGDARQQAFAEKIERWLAERRSVDRKPR